MQANKPAMLSGLMFVLTVSIALPMLGAAAQAQDTAPTSTEAVGALSAEEVQAWREGRGMGMGMVAMQHGYPGPRHVLAQAEALELDDEQRAASARLMAAMKSEAVALGGQIVELERELDAGFAAGTIDAATLERLVTEIGRLQARVRLAHLNAHLGQYELLSAEQRAVLASAPGGSGMHAMHGGRGGHGKHGNGQRQGRQAGHGGGAAGSCSHGQGKDGSGGCGCGHHGGADGHGKVGGSCGCNDAGSGHGAAHGGCNCGGGAGCGSCGEGCACGCSGHGKQAQ